MSENLIINLDDSNGDNFIDGTNKMILLDFWAEYCSPCVNIGKLLDEVAPLYSSKIVLAKVNIDDNPQLPIRFSVRSIPTLLILKKGEIIDTHIGPLNLTQLKTFIEKNI